ncbi:MAG: hypothetical protein ABIH20_00520 [Candidatus Diapherotrites archaeon]
MKQLIIKIGVKMDDDLRKIYNDPKKGTPGSHTLYLKSAHELYELLSPKRIELLSFVINQSTKKTIGEISKKLKRKQEAISRDATILSKHELIQKSKEKQKTYLKPKYNSLQIQLAN